MTAVTDSKPRANRHGDPCPPWCDTNHHTPIWKMGSYNDSHHGAHANFEASGEGITMYTRAGVHTFQQEGRPEPVISVQGYHYVDDGHIASADLFLSAYDAQHMATLIEALADFEPDQLRALAVAVRVQGAAIEDARKAARQ